MGVHNTEVFLNVGLCCFYSQQYDIALNCLLRALSLASNDHLADVWYNIGLVALVSAEWVGNHTHAWGGPHNKLHCSFASPRLSPSLCPSLCPSPSPSLPLILSLCVAPVQGVGDSNMAYQSFKLVLVHDNNHAEALNNLGVLEWKRGRGEVVRARREHKEGIDCCKEQVVCFYTRIASCEILSTCCVSAGTVVLPVEWVGRPTPL